MRSVATALLIAVLAVSAAAEDIPLTNWPVPQTSSRGQVGSNADSTKASVFVAIAPCRLVDTRNPAGAFGGPSFSAGQTRLFAPAFGPCTGIPTGAIAFSLNFTILNYNPNAGSFIAAYPGNAARPFVSTLNWGSGVPVANSAVVPVAATPPNVGDFAVFAGAPTDLIIDVNGYFVDESGALNPGTKLSLLSDVANGPVVQARNISTTGSIGVLGSLLYGSTTEGAGVKGTTQSGPSWGVIGSSASFQNRSGGVFGIAGERATQQELRAIGVRGDSPYGDGVAGFTLNGTTGAAVSGNRVDSNGVLQTYGLLGAEGYGVFSFGNIAGTGAKSFIDPHPTDASKVIRYVALEGPEAGTYFRGRGRFVGGQATIEVPESFRIVTEEDGLTVHITPVGGLAMVGVMKESLEEIVVASSRDLEFTYIVHGVRRGYAGHEAIGPGNEFRPRSASEPMPSYLNDEQKRALIENGTYNADGTVNLETAQRLGWTRAWDTAKERVTGGLKP